MILSEKSATFRDHALAALAQLRPALRAKSIARYHNETLLGPPPSFAPSSKPRRGERCVLARRDAFERELLDRLVEQPIIIELGRKMQKHAAEPDRGAVHEHEFARHPHRAFFPQRAVDREGL